MTIIKQRRGTATEWLMANPILSAGEEGFEIDTGKVKIGNGFSTWSTLDYFIPKAAIDILISLARESALQRSAHLGVQPISSVTNLQLELDKKLESINAASLPPGDVMHARKSGSTWPSRPTSRADVMVVWIGADPAPPIVTSGISGMLNNVDVHWLPAT